MGKLRFGRRGTEILRRTQSGPLVLAVLVYSSALAQNPLVPAKTIAAKLASTRKLLSSGAPTVRNVSVLQGKSSIEVHIEGSAALKPVATRLSAPERIVIDFPEVGYGRTKHVPIHAGDVNEVRVGLFQSDPPITRVVVDLARSHEYRVLAAGKVVIVQVQTEPASAAPPAAVQAHVAPPRPAASIQPESGPEPADLRMVEPPRPERAGMPAVQQSPSVPPIPERPGGADSHPAATEVRPQVSPKDSMPIPQVATVYVPRAPQEEMAPSPAASGEEETTPHQAAKANKPGRLQNIAVSREKDSVEVRIEANKPLRATATTLDSPARIVVDLPDVRLQRARRIPVFAADVRDVNVSLYLVNPLTTRVVVSLERAHAYRLSTSGNTLTLRIEGEDIHTAEKPAR